MNLPFQGSGEVEKGLPVANAYRSVEQHPTPPFSSHPLFASARLGLERPRAGYYHRLLISIKRLSDHRTH